MPEFRSRAWYEKMKTRAKKLHAKDGASRKRLRIRYQRLSEQLREVIRGSGIKVGKIAKFSGVKLEVVKSFLGGGSSEYEIRIHNFEMLAEFFGLSLQMKPICTVNTKPS